MNKRLLNYTMTQQLKHGKKVSGLAYLLAEKLGLPEEERYELALSGLLHDIGKTALQDEIRDQDVLVVEELGCIRRHPQLGYEMLRKHHFPDDVCYNVLYHHENFDGTGYPFNLRGYDIPIGARILRVCDVFCALTDNRPYRKAFTPAGAIWLMINETKDYDLEIFLAFQQMLHDSPDGKIVMPECEIDMKGELTKLWL